MISKKDATERRRKIKLSAYALFQEKGVDGVTFGHIARHCGISESSIYHYFHQKSKLMLELQKYLWREIAGALRARTVEVRAFQEASGYRQIDWLIEALQEIHLEHPEYLRFALECKLYWIRKKTVISRDEHEGVTAPVLNEFAEALRKGVRDKSVVLGADFDSCCFLLWGVLRAYIEQMVASDMLYAGTSSFSQYSKLFKLSILKTMSP